MSATFADAETDGVVVPRTLEEYCISTQSQAATDSNVDMADFYDDDYLEDCDDYDDDDDSVYNDNDGNDDSGNSES